MSLFKRALLFLTRKRGRTVILLLILTVIAALVLTCISIGRASDLAAENLRETMGGYFKVQANTQGSGLIGSVDQELVDKIADLGGIRAVNGMAVEYMLVNDAVLTPGRFTSMGDEKAALARVLGNTDTALHEYFVLRTFTLTDGRHVTDGDGFQAVVSRTFAEMNGLTPGDTFSVRFMSEYVQDVPEELRPSFAMTVAGIYDITSDQPARGADSAECDIPENFIFTSMTAMREIEAALGQDKERGLYAGGAAFFVTDPKNMERIIAGVKSLPGYNWDGFEIIRNNTAYNRSAVPLERMSGLITVFLLVMIAVSLVILSLILIMWMRDRKYETGVYLSLGIKKGAILAQHLAENLIIAVLAFLLAWGISAFAAGRLGDALLGAVVENTEVEETAEHGPLMYRDPLAVRELDTEELVSIRTGVTEFLIVVGVGALIVVISTVVSSLPVLRMKPRDIFSSLN